MALKLKRGVDGACIVAEGYRGWWRAGYQQARLAQSVERLALNQVVVGSSPTVGVFFGLISNLLRQNI